MTLFFINIGKTGIWILMSIRAATAAITTGWMHSQQEGETGEEGTGFLSHLYVFTLSTLRRVFPSNPSWKRCHTPILRQASWFIPDPVNLTVEMNCHQYLTEST